MSSRRAKRLWFGAVVAGSVAFGAGVGWYKFARPVRTVAPEPTLAIDLSRWPAEFKNELEAAIAAVKQRPDNPESLSRLAVLYAANDFRSEAEELLTKLCVLQPANARWPYYLATLLTRRGRFEEAEMHFRATLRLAPDYSPAAFQLGQLLAGVGRDSEAKIYYEQRLEKAPSDSLATMGLVAIERRNGNDLTAIDRLKRLLALNPTAGEARLLLAEMLDSAGRNIEGAHHRRAMANGGVATPPEDPWMDELYHSSFDSFRLQTLGTLHLQANDPNKALPYLQRASTLAPLDPDAQTTYAQCLVTMGKLDEARAVLEAAITRLPKEPILPVRLGDLLLRRESEVHAQKVLAEGLGKNPNSPEIHDAIGRMYYRGRRYTEAIASFSEALRLSPVMTDTRLNLGRALGAAGRRQEARAAIAEAVEMRPAFTEGILLLARVDLEDGNFDNARVLGRRLLDLDPGSPSIQQLYEQIIQRSAAAAFDTGGAGAAERIYREGIAAAPAMGPLHGNLGAFLAKQNRMDEAIVPFERYTGLSPQDPRAWLFLGTALRAVGRQDAATTALDRGLQAAQAIGDTRRALLIEQMMQKQ